MRIKKCVNCQRIAEYVNGTCMKCGFKEGDIPTYERMLMESYGKKSTFGQNISAASPNIGGIWYTVAFWLPLVGFQFASALLCGGEEREAETLLRTAIKGMLVWAGVFVLLMLAAIIIIVGMTQWGWG